MKKIEKVTRKKIAVVMTLIFVVLYFLAVTFIWVLNKKSGNISDSVLPIFIASISTTVAIVTLWISIGKSDKQKDVDCK